MIILVVSNFRLTLDTFKRHGFVLLKSIPSTDELKEDPLREFPAFSGMLLMNVFLLAAFFLEKLLAKKILPERAGLLLHFLNAAVSLIVPTYIVWVFQPSPLLGVMLLMTGVTM